MNTQSHQPRQIAIKTALTPILWFAPVTAVISWAAAWVFRDHVELMTTLIGVGCLPILVALSAYFYVLVNSVRD